MKNDEKNCQLTLAFKPPSIHENLPNTQQTHS